MPSGPHTEKCEVQLLMHAHTDAHTDARTDARADAHADARADAHADASKTGADLHCKRAQC